MFKLPEDRSKLSLAELQSLRDEAIAARTEIASIEDDTELRGRLAEFDQIVADIATLDGEIADAEAADADAAARIAAARATLEDPAGGDDADEDDAEDDEDEPDAAAETAEREAIAASARRGAAGQAARRAPKPKVDDEEPKGPKVAIVAAANVPSHNTGAPLASMRETALAFQSRSEGWKRTLKPGENGDIRPVELSKSMTRHGVARINKGGGDFAVHERMSTQEQFDIIMEAAQESRLPKGGLIAAGGWCAPSETIYDQFCKLETVSGILSIPEVTAARGGINFTKGPDYAAIAANWGFMQTEAQAEAGTEKVCYPVECPPFEEVRLDAIGFCVTAGVLTEAAYPELIDRVLQIGAVAHAHKVNASVINRILGYIGAAVNHAEIGSTTADLLQAVDIQALRLRYTYAMAPEATLEAIFPVWAKAIFRADLSRRTGVDMLAITDADINRYFAVRGVAVQWVYDWQPFNATATGTWTSLPDTLEFVMYPAGAYVKLTTDVLSLDTIYDSVGLSTNTFTAAFFEEGLAVANTCGAGVRVSVDVASLYGQTGAANLGTPLPAVTP